MTKPGTVILVVAESRLGAGQVALCENRAVATYYLAQLAARRDLTLDRHTRSGCYDIGPTHYDVIAGQVLDLAAVNVLRKEHEP